MYLALREIRRAKTRFALVVGAVGLLGFLILFQQTLLGNLLGFFTGGLANQSGDVVVYGADARRNLAGSVVPPPAVAAVAEVPGVGRAGPLYEATFTVRPAGRPPVDGVLFGYRLGGPGYPTTLSAGRLPRAPFEGVASAVDAGQGFGIGRRVTVLPAPGRRPVRIRIVGLADDLRFSVQPTVFTSEVAFVAARRSTNPQGAGVQVAPSAVTVETRPGVDPDAVARRITQTVPGVEALTRREAVASAPGVAATRQSFGVILGLAFVVVALVVGFFLVILVVQKAGALALLRAVGAPAGMLVRTLVLQTVLLVGAGIGLGVALLGLAAARSSPTFPISVDPAMVAMTCVAILVLALAAAGVAVRRVLRIDPLQAALGPTVGGLA